MSSKLIYQYKTYCWGSDNSRESWTECGKGDRMSLLKLTYNFGKGQLVLCLACASPPPPLWWRQLSRWELPRGDPHVGRSVVSTELKPSVQQPARSWIHLTATHEPGRGSPPPQALKRTQLGQTSGLLPVRKPEPQGLSEVRPWFKTHRYCEKRNVRCLQLLGFRGNGYTVR